MVVAVVVVTSLTRRAQKLDSALASEAAGSLAVVVEVATVGAEVIWVESVVVVDCVV